ncbi:MAG: magnesium/cobalt transporter CorA [Elusimicrobiota bacterium]
MVKLISRFIKKKQDIGLPPGTLPSVDESVLKSREKVGVEIIDYNEKDFSEQEPEEIEKCFEFITRPSVTWININGIHDTRIIEKIGQQLNLHPLVLEDIANTDSRTKYEEFDEYLFIILKMLYLEKDELVSEQVSIVMGKNYVISFQEKKGDVFESVRDRIRSSKGRIRKKGSDYLVYSLIDAVVDGYFKIPESIGDKLEGMEVKLIEDPETEDLQKVHNLKRNLIFLRRSIWPLREVINSFIREDSEMIEESTKLYLRDVYDHTIQVIETVETLRDVVSGMVDMYMSSVSNRMNEVMKVLTIIATIFIPLTFIAGIYGMNFEYMPELSWKGSYFVVLGVMVIIGVSMIIYFKKKRWM